METSCIATVNKFQSLSTLFLRALRKLLAFPPALLKRFSKKEHHQPPLLELPQDILMDIFSLLEIPDLVRAASVCPSWFSAYTSLRTFQQYKQSQTPCLLYTSETHNENVACFYSLVDKRSYNFIFPDTTPTYYYSDIFGSSNGWVVTVDDRSEMHLLNPITGEHFALPSVITLEHVTPILDESGAICKYRFMRFYYTNLTTTVDLNELWEHWTCRAFVFYDTLAENYIVVLIHDPASQLSFAWLGDDKWTWLSPKDGLPDDWYRDCAYKDGLLYAMTSYGEIFVIDLRGPIITVKLIMERNTSYAYDHDYIYIVHSPCGALLQVRLELDAYNYDDDTVSATYASNTEMIDIFKVDTAAQKLVKINSLDDHVVVLGPNQSLCLSAKEYPQLKANHVYCTQRHGYFTDFGHVNNYYTVVFDLANNSREELLPPQLRSNSPAPIWITPTLTKLSTTPV